MMKDMKKPGPMNEKDSMAKMDVLKTLHRMMSEAMGNDAKSMKDMPLEGAASPSLKKVTVASDSKPGLEHGLEKAQDLLSKHGDMSDSSDMEPDDDDDEMLEAAKPEEDEADLERQIQMLHEKKAALAAKKRSY